MSETPPEPAAVAQPDTTPVDTISIDPHATSDGETLFFDSVDPDDQARRKLKLLNDRIDQDNALSKDYAKKAFGFATAWLVFLMIFITAETIAAAFGMAMSDKAFIAVVISLTASVFGFWSLVGRYLFPKHDK